MNLVEQTAVDVSADGNSTAACIDGNSRARGNLAWIFELTALTGGTSPDVTVTWEHSPDGQTWFTIAQESALTAAGFKARLARENTLSHVRISWATTGSPTTATASMYIQTA